MAELDKVEFEFPDEIEAKNEAKNEAKAEITEDDSNIEVVTTESNEIKPAPAPDEVTEEELSKYSDKKLKERLAHLGRGYHDEKRARERAFQEKEEAIKFAQSVIEENKKLKGSLSQGQNALLEQANHLHHELAVA